MSVQSLETSVETRVRYLYLEYYQGEEDETYTFTRLVLYDNPWETGGNGTVYKLVGEITIPEQDFQDDKDGENSSSQYRAAKGLCNVRSCCQ